MVQISNKERILVIKDIFFRETDERHKISFEDILDKLKFKYGPEYDITIKAIKDDVRTLVELEHNISESRIKHGKKVYSQQHRLFEINELRTLVDAVSSAGSISTRDKERIIDKIKMLTSKGIADSLSNQIYTELRVVNQDSSFRYNLDSIHIAVQNKNKISFSYGRYDVNKKFNLSDKKYIVHPYGLVWESGFYYLVGYDETKEKIINFRVDRIRLVNIINEKYKKDLEFKLSRHVNDCFNMYPGDISSIEIKFHKHLINAIIDRFGVKANIKPLGEEYFVLYTRASINKGLVRWILNWGSDAEVLKPKDLIDEIKSEIKSMTEVYKKNT